MSGELTVVYNDAGLWATLSVNLIIFGVLFTIFVVLQWFDVEIYTARLHNGGKANTAALKEPRIGFKWPLEGCHRVCWGLECWFQLLSDEEILNASGLRSLLVLLFQRSMLVFSFIVAVVSISLAFSVNFHGGYNEEIARNSSGIYEKGFYDWSTNNVAPQDPRLWAHFMALVLISIAAYTVSFLSLKSFRFWRHKYFKLLQESARGGDCGLPGENLTKRDHVWARAVARHTVMIGNLPRQLRSPGDLKDFIETYMYRGSILKGGVEINLSMTMLLNLYKKQQETKTSYKDSSQSEHFRPGCWKASQPKKRYFAEECHKVCELMKKERRRKDHPTTGYAFVTMYDHRIAKQLVQNMYFQWEKTTVKKSPEPDEESKHDESRNQGDQGPCDVTEDTPEVESYPLPAGFLRCCDRLSSFKKTVGLTTQVGADEYEATKWEVQSAPPPSDIIWENLDFSNCRRTLYCIVYGVLRVAMVVCWALSVSALTVWAQEAQSLSPLVSAYLPSLLVMTFHALLPWILSGMTYATGVTTRSEIALRVMEDFYVFSVVSALVLPTILTENWGKNSREAFLAEPFKRTFETITQITSPQTSSFYATLVIQYALTGTMYALLRVVPLLTGWVIKLRATKSSAVERAGDANGPCTFYLVYGNNLVILTITLFFALTMPIITPLALLYFLLKYLVERYLVSFVYPTPTDTGKGGDMYAAAMQKFLVIVAFCQIAAFTTFVGKECYLQASFSLVLVGVTGFMHSRLGADLRRIFMEDLCVPYMYEDQADQLTEQQKAQLDHDFARAYCPPGWVPDPVEEELLQQNL